MPRGEIHIAGPICALMVSMCVAGVAVLGGQLSEQRECRCRCQCHSAFVSALERKRLVSAAMRESGACDSVGFWRRQRHTHTIRGCARRLWRDEAKFVYITAGNTHNRQRRPGAPLRPLKMRALNLPETHTHTPIGDRAQQNSDTHKNQMAKRPRASPTFLEHLEKLPKTTLARMSPRRRVASVE